MNLNPTEFPQDEKPFSIDGDVGILECVAKSVENPKGLGIICHPHPLYQGSMHNKVVHTAARAFNNKNLNTIRFNYRGVGESEGEFGDSIGEVEDLNAVIRWAQSVMPNHKLWLAGFSFGSFIAAKGAILHPCQQLFTIAPAVHHQPYEQVANVACPWVVIQGTQDEVVPPEQVYDWFQRQQAQSHNAMQLIKLDASHYYHGTLVILRAYIESTFLDI
tara:strand:+ start:25152 stop:25805 length:654 start_codon:yes stop_codon:yes gene_type:complete